MYITKCDICKTVIKDDKTMVNPGNSFHFFHLCGKCAKPIKLFLEKHGLLEQAKPKSAKSKQYAN